MLFLIPKEYVLSQAIPALPMPKVKVLLSIRKPTNKLPVVPPLKKKLSFDCFFMRTQASNVQSPFLKLNVLLGVTYRLLEPEKLKELFPNFL